MACAGHLSEDHLLCSICLEVFTDPVSTPCGHNYCKACITRYWDTGDVCKCPLCNKTFYRRPEVSVNTLFSGMVQHFRSHMLKEEYEAKTEAQVQQMIQERRLQIQEGKRSVDHFLCSICLEVFTDPVSTPCGHNYCKACITRYWDTGDVCKCPLCNKTFYRRLEVSVNTLFSGMVQQFRSHMLKEEYEAKTEAEVQQMIQERRLKIQEVKRSVELSIKDADEVIVNSVQVFTALISCIERSQAELIDVVEEKQKTTEKQAEAFIEDLQQEVTQLENKISELKQLSHTEDHLHLLQNFTSMNTQWRPTKDWTKVNVHQSSHVGTLRIAVSQLEKTLSQEMEKQLCDAELRRIQQYEVDVTLDPDTAHPRLIVSEDGKQVSDRNIWNNTKRFCYYVEVLGKQGISSGRCYYEVQVAGKSDWSLGVARESINRKGPITKTPNNGYWIIVLRNGNKYTAADDPTVLLSVREELQKVGVFVDYEEGLVSFYDVKSRVHLYSFTGCTFTEKLFPLFTPYLKAGGRNSAPLTISPVTIGRFNNLGARSKAEAGGPAGGPAGGRRSAIKRPRLSP